MRSSKIILLATLLALSIISFAQIDKRQILGRIVDDETSKPIAYADVTLSGLALSTSTNQLGFFQFEIPPNAKELIISRIGYEASKVVVPDVNKFQIKLKRVFILLPLIDLNSPSLSKTDLDPSWKSPIDSFPNNTNAQYDGGWMTFSTNILEILRTDSVLNSLSDTLTHVRFSSEIDGSFSIISVTPKNNLMYNLLKSTYKLNHWKSAVQNNKTITQYFDLPIGKDIEEVFTVIEETATPVGGFPDFYKFVFKNLKYPQEAKRKGIEGKVYVQFIIQMDGSISDIKVIHSLGFGCDEEAIRIMSIAPKWIPGKQRGNPVRQRYTLPIIFRR